MLRSTVGPWLSPSWNEHWSWPGSGKGKPSKVEGLNWMGTYHWTELRVLLLVQGSTGMGREAGEILFMFSHLYYSRILAQFMGEVSYEASSSCLARG